MFRFYTIIALITELSVVALLASITNDPRAFVLLVILAPATVIGAFMLRSFMDDPARRTRSLSPESIAGYRSPEESAGSGERLPREISRSIVERSDEIQRTMSESPSEIQTEMCAIGYRSCVNDMITLTHKINAALPEAGLVGRMLLRADRRRATDSLAKARRSLPPGALRATRQELQ